MGWNTPYTHIQRNFFFACQAFIEEFLRNLQKQVIF